jgi:hypothetical protein
MGTRILAVPVVAALIATGCGDGSKTPGASSGNAGALIAQFASYDVTAGRAQRVIVGLQTGDGLVSYGTARFSFTYLGTKAQPSDPQPGPTVDAAWIPVPGQQLPDSPPTEPRVVTPPAGIGVYGGTVRFDRAGFWRVTATVTLDGKPTRGDAAFAVNDKATAIDVGDPAPKNNNLILGATPPAAVDSRARNGPIPDPQLHRQTVAKAVTSGRPTMVVISTPVYCVSRFCGPITDSVASLARRYGKRMNFIHLEVWKNFQTQTANIAAAEWIYLSRAGDLHEPWVYVVDSNGTVTHRFDNVASDEELANAVEQAVSTS